MDKTELVETLHRFRHKLFFLYVTVTDWYEVTRGPRMANGLSLLFEELEAEIDRIEQEVVNQSDPPSHERES